MPPLVVDQNEWFSAASSAPTRGRVAVNQQQELRAV
jgi:hypothetical protein